MVELALTGVPAERRLETTLVALEYLVPAGEHSRALGILQSLLTDPPFSESSELWRLTAHVSQKAGHLARSIDQLERAAELDYHALTDQYNVPQVRATYSHLVERYQELAQVVAGDSHTSAARDLATRAIQSVDRWRALDPDVTEACQQAAKLLNTLGQQDLAWDYLTTPLANQPNESTPWLNLARAQRDADHVDLADRAFAAAWEAEPTNAAILWERAQMLELDGRHADARQHYQRLADGPWQPRFRPIQGRAQRILAAVTD